MPSLSNGNTCWGNRKAFNMCTEYISDSFLLGLEMRGDLVAVRPNFISTNHYYGYHRIPDTQVSEEMVVDECSPTNCEQLNLVCRKRSIATEQNNYAIKRVRHQESNQHSISSDTICRSQAYNSGFCLF